MSASCIRAGARRYELPHAPVLFELSLDALRTRVLPQFKPVRATRPSSRDLALVVGDDVSHDELMRVLRDDPSGLVRSALLFDVYRPSQPSAGIGAGERSLAVRLDILDENANLTDERIDAAVAAAVQRAHGAFGARLRA